MSSTSDDLYLSHAAVIERMLAAACRRHLLFGADAEDFSSMARLHLIENDCAVLRRFQGRSALSSYLAVVITRQFQDWRNARWGKWRPSAEAKRLGALAIRLETLTVRDGLSLDEAHELLRAHHGISESRGALESIAARFPRRSKRSFVTDDAAEGLPSPAESAEDAVIAAEAAAAVEDASRTLVAAMKALAAQDRLILRMRFEDGCSVADIARVLRLEAKPLYRHIEKLLAALRQTLQARGVTASDLGAVWSLRGFESSGDGETRVGGRLFSRRSEPQTLTGGPRD